MATPADWKLGEDVIIVPAVSDEEAKKRFPKRFTAKQPFTYALIAQPQSIADCGLRDWGWGWD